MPYDLETKDGIVIRNVPDDAPEEELRVRVAKIRAERDAAPQEPQEAPQEPEGVGAKALKGFGTGVSSIAGLAEMLATAGVSLGRPEEEGWGYKARDAMADVGLAREPGVPPEGFVDRASEFLGAGAVPYLGMLGWGKKLAAGAEVVAPNILQKMALSTAQRPAVTATAEALGAGGAAAGGEYAASDYPESPYSQAALEVLGGLAAPMALSGPTARLASFAAKQTVGRGRDLIQNMRDPVLSEGRAAARLQQAAGDPEAALAAMQGPNMLPMSIGQRIESPETVGIERAMAEGDPAIAARLETIRQDAQRMAREIPLSGLEGDTEDVRSALTARKRKLVGRRAREAARLGEESENALRVIGEPAELREVGTQARQNLDTALEQKKLQEDAAWAKVDKAVPAKYDNAVGAFDEFESSLGVDVNRADIMPSWLEKRVQAYKKAQSGAFNQTFDDFASTFPPKTDKADIATQWLERRVAAGEQPTAERNIKDLLGFRSSILSEARAEAAKDAPNGNKLRLLNKMQEALLDDLTASGAAGTTEARAVSAELNKTFRQGPVGRILGYERTGDAAIPPDATIRSLFSGSREVVADNIDRLERASPETLKQVEDFVKTEFLNLVFEKGRPVPSAVKAFLGTPKYAEALKRFPLLKQQLSNAGETQRLYEQAAKLKTTVSEGLLNRNKSVAALYLDSDPGQEIASAMASRTQYKTMRKLYADVSKDPRARQGLQANTIQHILDKSTIDGVMTSKALKKNIKEYAAALDGVELGAPERARLDRVARELERIETPVGPKHIIDDPQNRFLTRALQVLGAKAAKLSPSRGDIQTPGILAQEGRTLANKVLSKADKSRDAIIAAIMDEKVYKEMLTMPATAKKGSDAARMRQTRTWLFGVNGEEGEE